MDSITTMARVSVRGPHSNWTGDLLAGHFAHPTAGSLRRLWWRPGDIVEISAGIRRRTMERMDRRRATLGFVLLAGLMTAAVAGEAPGSARPPQPELVSTPNLADFYTKEMQEDGESGRVRVKACIDTAGRITEVGILDSSGFERLDQAAMRFVRGYTFKAGRVDGVAVGGCYGLPVSFVLPDAGKARILVQPDLMNAYPASAKQRGQEGIVRVRICFDAQGIVTEVTLAQSSGVAALDKAGVQAGKQFRFKPGVRDGVPQADCLTAPLNFHLVRMN